MKGAILGNIVGSIYEKDEILGNYSVKSRLDRGNNSLFTSNNSYTGDTLQILAMMEAINNNVSYESMLKKYGNEYLYKKNKKYLMPMMFSSYFYKYIKFNYRPFSTEADALVRVLPISFYSSINSDARDDSSTALALTNDNEKSLNVGNYLSKILSDNILPKEIINVIVEIVQGYNIDYDFDKLCEQNIYTNDIEEVYKLVLYLFSISNSFEDAMHNAILVGGNTSTTCALLGGLIESHYGISDEYDEVLSNYLENDKMAVVNNYYSKIKAKKR